MLLKSLRAIISSGILLASIPMVATHAESSAALPSDRQLAFPSANSQKPSPQPVAQNAPQATPQAAAPEKPMLTATPPSINGKGFILVDANSGKVLAEQNADQRMPPASLTKMMTSYIASSALKQKRIHLDDLVPVSEAAWRTGGSKMFIKVGTQVSVRDLLQGIIVDSGNDACVAIAEFLAGSEESFANLMNQQAKLLGMKNTHFVDANGLPDPNHYTTPRDMAILARALINDFPEDYKLYSQKWFIYNGIRQPNRNRLLWRDPTVDGIKTGHTDDAGFCLVASGVHNGTRLISVLMGAPSDAVRANDSQKLLTYGYRFFETHKLYQANTQLAEARVFQGKVKNVPVGISNDFYITIPAGQHAHLKASMALNNPIQAPIQKGQTLGTMNIMLRGNTVATTSLVALENDPRGSLWRRLSDRISMYFNS